MHPKYHELFEQIKLSLEKFSENTLLLPGIQDERSRNVLAMQLVESQRKIDRTMRLALRKPNSGCLCPGSGQFDPERAAVHYHLNGALDEACWLVFLSVHFGMHGKDGWLLCGQIYGALGPTPYWTWERTSRNLGEFRDWLSQTLQTRNGPLGRFGNHRKYESLDSPALGLASVIASYVAWVNAAGSHSALMGDAIRRAQGNPKIAFSLLYKSMGNVLRFGRLGKFDYLTMISKLGLAQIEADSTYLANATGPKRGAKLLFLGSKTVAASNSDLESKVAQLAAHLSLGMQAMEDALCNWQKSPKHFIAFRG